MLKILEFVRWNGTNQLFLLLSSYIIFTVSFFSSPFFSLKNHGSPMRKKMGLKVVLGNWAF